MASEADVWPTCAHTVRGKQQAPLYCLLLEAVSSLSQHLSRTLLAACWILAAHRHCPGNSEVHRRLRSCQCYRWVAWTLSLFVKSVPLVRAFPRAAGRVLAGAGAGADIWLCRQALLRGNFRCPTSPRAVSWSWTLPLFVHFPKSVHLSQWWEGWDSLGREGNRDQGDRSDRTREGLVWE